MRKFVRVRARARVYVCIYARVCNKVYI